MDDKIDNVLESIDHTKFLLVEDDDSHSKLIHYAFHKQNLHSKIIRLSNGKDVLPYLRKEGRFSFAETPDVILLDLNIPEINGIEVLRTIKMDPKLKVIPVVILTTSRSLNDREQAYMNYANSYLVKPINYDNFRKMVRDLNEYWTVWNQKIEISN